MYTLSDKECVNKKQFCALVFLSKSKLSCTLLVTSYRQLMCISRLEVIILMSRADTNEEF